MDTCIKVFVIFCVVVAIGGIVMCVLEIVFNCRENNRIPEVASKFGYNEGDVRAFLENTDYTLVQFETSEGVRNNFKKWKNGEGTIGRKTEVVNTPVVVPIVTGR